MILIPMGRISHRGILRYTAADKMVAPKKDRSDWVIRKCDSFEEMERLHVQGWQAVSGSERAKAAWQMVLDAWEIKKRDPNELRFQRVVTVVNRPAR